MYVYLIEKVIDDIESEILYVFLFEKYAYKKWIELIKQNIYCDVNYYVVKKRLLI